MHVSSIPAYPTNAMGVKPHARPESSLGAMSDSYLKPVTASNDYQENFINDTSGASTASHDAYSKHEFDPLTDVYRDAMMKSMFLGYRDDSSMSSAPDKKINDSLDDDAMYG